MPIRYVVLSLIAATLFVPAAAVAQAIRTSDSAGIHIVENPSRLARAVNLKLSDKPVIDVGGLDDQHPDNEFTTGQGYLRGAWLNGGGVAVSDVSRVQYFDRAGKRTGITGRVGAGPADFGYITAICQTRGDTVAVGDSRNHRVSVIDAAGKVVRTIPADAGTPPFDFCFDDGTFILSKPLPAAAGAPQLARLTRLRLDGSVANVVGDFPGGGYDLLTQEEPTIIAAGQKLYFGAGDASEFRIFSPAGKLLSIVRSNDPLQPITGAEVDAHLDATIPTNVSPTDRAARLQELKSRPHPDHWPAYNHMYIDRQGRIWLEDYRKDYSAAYGWSVFDPAGRLTGRLMIPATPKGSRRLEIIGFGDDDILVRRQDSDGADHLTAYGILGLGREKP